MEDERPMFIPANCLPTNKTSWASSHSVSSPKHEIYSAPAFAFVHYSLTTQFTLFLKLSNSSCLPPTSSQLKLCFALNLTKYSSLKLFRPKKKMALPHSYFFSILQSPLLSLSWFKISLPFSLTQKNDQFLLKKILSSPSFLPPNLSRFLPKAPSAPISSFLSPKLPQTIFRISSPRVTYPLLPQKTTTSPNRQDAIV